MRALIAVSEMVSQNCVGDLGRVIVVRLVTVPPFSVIVVSGDTFHAGAAWDDGRSSRVCGAESMRYLLHFVKEGYNLPDGIHFLQEFKPILLLPSLADKDEIMDVEMNIQCEETLPIAETDVQPPAPEKGHSRSGNSSLKGPSDNPESKSNSDDYMSVPKKRKSQHS